MDTWAHENFVGYFDEMNVLKGVLQKTKPARIGHAGAGTWPDRPCMVWEDCRLVTPHVKRDNKARFLTAAGHLFVMLRKHRRPLCSDEVIEGQRAALVRELGAALGPPDQENRQAAARIRRYKTLATRAVYGRAKLVDYDLDKWFDEAIKERIRIFRIRGKGVFWRTLKGYLAERVTFVRDI